MSTYTVSYEILHTNDVQFQAWASSLYAQIVATGATQTADTGQLAVPVVAVRPAINTMAGYWVFEINDSLSGTNPLYFKVEVGTRASANIPGIYVTISTSTDGAGTMTGVSSTRKYVGNNVTPAAGLKAAIGSKQNGYFAVLFGLATTDATLATGGFIIMRGTDASATPVATSYSLVTIADANTTPVSSNAYQQDVVISPPTTYTGGNTQIYTIYGTGPSSSFGGNIQVFNLFQKAPNMSPSAFLCGMYYTEIPLGTVFTAKIKGTTTRTFRSVGVQLGRAMNVNDSGLAIVWE